MGMQVFECMVVFFFFKETKSLSLEEISDLFEKKGRFAVKKDAEIFVAEDTQCGEKAALSSTTETTLKM